MIENEEKITKAAKYCITPYSSCRDCAFKDKECMEECFEDMSRAFLAMQAERDELQAENDNLQKVANTLDGIVNYNEKIRKEYDGLRAEYVKVKAERDELQAKLAETERLLKSAAENVTKLENIVFAEPEQDNRPWLCKHLGVEVGEEFTIGACVNHHMVDKDGYLLMQQLSGKWEKDVFWRYNELVNATVDVCKDEPTTDEVECMKVFAKAGYKWFVKDGDDTCWAFSTKPIKDSSDKIWRCQHYYETPIDLHFLSWEDAEPYYFNEESEQT